MGEWINEPYFVGKKVYICVTVKSLLLNLRGADDSQVFVNV